MAVEPSGRDTDRGPGFWDVQELARSIEKAEGGSVIFQTFPTKSVNGKWGFHITVRVDGSTGAFGSCGYGPAYPGTGGKTMAASMYHALIRLDEDIHRIRQPGEPPYVQHGWLSEVKA